MFCDVTCHIYVRKNCTHLHSVSNTTILREIISTLSMWKNGAMTKTISIKKLLAHHHIVKPKSIMAPMNMFVNTNILKTQRWRNTLIPYSYNCVEQMFLYDHSSFRDFFLCSRFPIIYSSLLITYKYLLVMLAETLCRY